MFPGYKWPKMDQFCVQIAQIEALFWVLGGYKLSCTNTNKEKLRPFLKMPLAFRLIFQGPLQA